MIRPLKLDADGEVIALLPPLVMGDTGVPGAPQERHELRYAALPVYEAV